MPKREQISHKGTFGKVLNFCGSEKYTGAAYLSAISSLKTGAGYSALATDKNVINILSAMFPDAVYMEYSDGIDVINNFDVVLVGCGLDINKKSVQVFKAIMKKLNNSEIPLIIDADGLNILSKIKIQLPENTIITPHPAEAARLLQISTDMVLANTKDSAKKLSEKYNCITVLKTHRTVICDKSYNVHINEYGNSALAKAGSGDVLSGIIAGLLAQKIKLFEAAKLGVYLHSKAGELASEELTEYSVLASDLLKYIPKAIKNCI